jgi:hypothetical protein
MDISEKEAKRLIDVAIEKAAAASRSICVGEQSPEVMLLALEMTISIVASWACGEDEAMATEVIESALAPAAVARIKRLSFGGVRYDH